MKPYLFLPTFFLLFLLGCRPAAPTPVKTYGLKENELAALGSLQKLDDHPLYEMKYAGAYPAASTLIREGQTARTENKWGCSLFAALGDDRNRLYGRNFDWQPSPVVFLFTDPPDGYASVSMVDIEYLGFDMERAQNLMDLSIEERKSLLRAPFLPFDGMNEKGIAVGMAAVPPGGITPDPRKETIGELRAIREILDHAATVDEAIKIIGSYNIDMSEVPIHYLIASAAGESALVEFHQGEMKVFRNESTWQQATNFLMTAQDDPAGACPRYDLIDERLSQTGGRISARDAMSLLEDVSQSSTSPTQWSAVYNMTDGSVNIVMGRRYATIHKFQLDMGE